MCEQAKKSILANDLVRRLSNVHENVFENEKLFVIDKYTTKLKVSGYSQSQTKEVIISGVEVWLPSKGEQKMERELSIDMVNIH